MSDDEDVTYVKKTQNIHYGSLEESERLKQQALEEIESDDDDFAEPEAKIARLGTVAAPAVGNVNTSTEYFDLDQEV